VEMQLIIALRLNGFKYKKPFLVKRKIDYGFIGNGNSDKS
jgi:hypothetical protein